MKSKISDNGDYAVFASVEKIPAGGKDFVLRFTSLKQNVNLVEEQVIAELFLTQDELIDLGNLVYNTTKPNPYA